MGDVPVLGFDLVPIDDPLLDLTVLADLERSQSLSLTRHAFDQVPALAGGGIARRAVGGVLEEGGDEVLQGVPVQRNIPADPLIDD